MKYRIKLEEFFKYAGIDYEEDLVTSSSINHEPENYSIQDIIHNIPKRYNFTEEQLEKDEVLKDALNQSLNEASYDSLIDECYKKQNEMVENVANKMVTYINQINDDGNEAINSITIDWQKDEVVIDVNVKTALSTTREIINGEGMFTYSTDNELAAIYDGKYNPGQAVEHHLHYLLNIKLIDDIFGLVGMPNKDWEVNCWDINEDAFNDRIEDNLTSEQLNLNAKTLLAINVSKELKSTKERAVELEGELEKAIKIVPKSEMNAFLSATA